MPALSQLSAIGRPRELLSLLALTAFAVTARAQAQGPPDVSARPNHGQNVTFTSLVHGESIVLPEPSPVLVSSGSVCDAKGNLFVILGEGPHPSPEHPLDRGEIYFHSPIRRVSPTAKAVTAFPLRTPQGYAAGTRDSFNVDPEGRLYILLRAYHVVPAPGPKPPADYVILPLNDDGSAGTPIVLEAIPGRTFKPLRFAVFANGTLLVAGLSPNPGTGAEDSIAAIFNPFGKFVADVPVPYSLRASTGPIRSSIDYVAPALPIVYLSAMTSAPDGNIYYVVVSDHPHVFAISPTGAIVKDFSILPSATGLDSTQMGVAAQISVVGGTSLAIVFGPVPGPGRASPETYFVSLDINSGQVTTVVDVGPALKSDLFPACAPSLDSWYFLGSSPDRHLTLEKFFLR